MLKLGDHSYGNASVHFNLDGPEVECGKFCSLASGINIFVTANHKHTSFSTYPFRELFGWNECPPNAYSKGTPTIGNDVWIGNSVTIYSGVHIGDGAVVAGNSVVARDVPPYSIVAGNPAVVKKYRFDPETIDQLLQLKWWDLPLDVIRAKLIPHIDDIPKFLVALEEIRQSEIKSDT